MAELHRQPCRVRLARRPSVALLATDQPAVPFRAHDRLGRFATWGCLDIGWGHQIRSYVLDQSRIKDLRTNVEVGNTQGVLDGDLDPFITASLKQGV